MKVLFFTKYTSKGASSRMRSYQYFPAFSSAQLSVNVQPFFSDRYLDNLYSGKRSVIEIVKCYIRRFIILFSVFKYDVIVIQSELFPFLPAWFEYIFNVLGVKYVVDYDDAIFHNYDLSSNLWIRKFLGNKIDMVMKYSTCVVAGNQYLAKRASLAGSKNIQVIPTVIDLERYKAKKEYSCSQFTIGWVGSPTTYQYIEHIKKDLLSFAKEHNARIIIIGAFTEEKSEDNFFYVPWDKESECDWIRKFDVGLMPLDDTPWAKGKCSFKLIQYMGCGVPVIASPVGMNTEVVTQENGFLAQYPEDWKKYLNMYYNSKELRESHGRKGRQMVEEKYTLDVTIENWITLLKKHNDI